MKTSPLYRTLLGLLLALGTTQLRAADTIRFIGKPGSTVTIDGTSNIHDWTVTSGIISGFFEAPAEFATDLKAVSPTPKVEATIPVRTLKSGKPKMDEIMQEHMNMATHKDIKYKLTELTLKGEPKGPNDPAEFVSKGDLTISGTTKNIEMPVTIERVDNSKLKIKGSIPLKMTDFGIKPPAPALAMGLIKTGDDVKVGIEWVVAKAAPAAAK